MKEIYTKYAAEKMGVELWKVENCFDLFAQAATVPFITRYRKEVTGGLDDFQVTELHHLYLSLTELEKRKESIIASVEKQGLMTDEFRQKLMNEVDATAVEDLYLPYRPKRRTRAAAAREAGFGPLAERLMGGDYKYSDSVIAEFARSKPCSVEEARAGASDIIAERINEMPRVRDAVRSLLHRRVIKAAKTKAADGNPDAANFRSWFGREIRISKIPAHAVLAMFRGQEEGFLSLSIPGTAEPVVGRVYNIVSDEFKFPRVSGGFFRAVIRDALERLTLPSVTTEIMNEVKHQADLTSIDVFGNNLRQLLMAPPMERCNVLAIDPGFRNGCKIACLDASGRLISHQVIYPHPPQSRKIESLMAVSGMIDENAIGAVALGNGTASRETEEFLSKIPLPAGCELHLVSEDGASVYSVSEAAREEFPDEDVTVRGAVSIGRRLIDPLAELVKIDPKSLGVGQYQHDVDQNLLHDRLDEVVEACVNSVGVNLNTASSYLLAYVSGIGPALARKIVAYRDANGPFSNRKELLKVPGLGARTFELCAGFLRVPESSNPLDNSAVHPEAYPLVASMAERLGVKLGDLVGDARLVASIVPDEFVGERFGLPTVQDVLEELVRPGRDPRGKLEVFSFAKEVRSIEDLQPGMELPGIVTNVTGFGAFVDMGIHKQGLLHDTVVTLPEGKTMHLALQQRIVVKVKSVDLERQRISLGFVRMF